MRREIGMVEQMLEGMRPGPDRARALRRLQLLNVKLAESRHGGKSLRLAPTHTRGILR